MNDNLTRAYIMDIYNNPSNYGKIQDYDFSKKENNPLCGDNITIYVKLNKNIIENISFESAGCIISNVSASILTKEIKGRSIADIKNNLKFEDIKEKLLIKLTPSREQCARLSFDTFISILKDNRL